MKLRSLGYRSELIFTSFDGQVDDRGDYFVVRTLTNPNYFWGNLLVFPHAPKIGDADRWIRIFKQEFPDPRVYHVTLAWDEARTGDVSEFQKLGYDLEEKVVLATHAMNPPPRPNADLQVRPLESDEDWERMIEIQTDSSHGTLPRAEWESFYRTQAPRYRAMAQAGRGAWFGGFLQKKLVAGMGLYHDGEIARYQSVSTDPGYWRQGICGTLVHRAGEMALKEWGAKELVMCADPEYHAARIYESVGFRKVGTEYGVYWWDKKRG